MAESDSTVNVPDAVGDTDKGDVQEDIDLEDGELSDGDNDETENPHDVPTIDGSTNPSLCPNGCYPNSCMCSMMKYSSLLIIAPFIKVMVGLYKFQ